MLQQLVNGLILGSVYALLALGYTMVYGIIKLINFAHGDIYMMGAFIGYFLINSFQMNFFVALIVAMLATAILGVVIGVPCLPTFASLYSYCCFDYSYWGFFPIGIWDGPIWLVLIPVPSLKRFKQFAMIWDQLA